MKVTAWNNGKHHASGAGYGLKISKSDRNNFINMAWKDIYIKLPGINNEVRINIDKSSFWNNSCRELISREIGKWLIDNKYAPWQKNNPPKFKLTNTHGNHFILVVKD